MAQKLSGKRRFVMERCFAFLCFVFLTAETRNNHMCETIAAETHLHIRGQLAVIEQGIHPGLYHLWSVISACVCHQISILALLRFEQQNDAHGVCITNV